MNRHEAALERVRGGARAGAIPVIALLICRYRDEANREESVLGAR